MSRACLHPHECLEGRCARRALQGASAEWSRYKSIPPTECVLPTRSVNSDFEAVFSTRVGREKVCPPSIQTRTLDFLSLSPPNPYFPPPLFLSQGVGALLFQTREGRLSSSLSPHPPIKKKKMGRKRKKKKKKPGSNSERLCWVLNEWMPRGGPARTVPSPRGL